MPDDLSQRGPRDRDRVNVNEPHELRYWTERFGCTEAQLRRAVGLVGPMADDVAAALRGTDSTTPSLR